MENVGIQAAAVNNVQPQTTVKKVEQVQVKDYPNDSFEQEEVVIEEQEQSFLEIIKSLFLDFQF